MEVKQTHTFPGASFHVDGRYVPQRIIGTGAYGVVCAANDTLTGAQVAIKKIKHVFEILTISLRTLREIKLLKHFHAHDNIISISTILRPPELPMPFRDIYLVMELLETDLHRIIHSEQPLTEEHVRYFLYQTLRGLKYIHSANVLHRDIKPPNLLITSSCDLKICDFGMARAMSTTPEEHKGFMTAYVATRWYRAPEVMLSFQEYTQAIDMWSVACIFAEMLGRKYLFPGTHYVHQLNLILNLLGTPPTDLIDSIGSEKAQLYIRSLPVIPPVTLNQLYPDASPEAIDLLGRMLRFDPQSRCSAEQALTHPFLARYHNPGDEPMCAPFEFDFEEDTQTPEQLEQRIRDEIMEYHRPNLLVQRHSESLPARKRSVEASTDNEAETRTGKRVRRDDTPLYSGPAPTDVEVSKDLTSERIKEGLLRKSRADAEAAAATVAQLTAQAEAAHRRALTVSKIAEAALRLKSTKADNGLLMAPEDQSNPSLRATPLVGPASAMPPQLSARAISDIAHDLKGLDSGWLDNMDLATLAPGLDFDDLSNELESGNPSMFA